MANGQRELMANKGAALPTTGDGHRRREGSLPLARSAIANKSQQRPQQRQALEIYLLLPHLEMTRELWDDELI